MRIAKYVLALGSVLVPFSAQLTGQTLQANIAGSTAFWAEAGISTYTLGNTATTCAWTTATYPVDGTSSVLDERVPDNPQYYPYSIDDGGLWVTWTPGATGTCANPSSDSQVWAYIGLDSVLGLRCFFANPPCTLNAGSFDQSTGTTTPVAAGTAGANALPGIVDTPIPASIISAFNGQAVSVAASDILPVDAKFATYSTLSTCGSLGGGTQFEGLGYGPGPIGSTDIYSYFSEYYLNVNDFNVYGTDPADGLPVGPYSITPVGAI